MKEIKTYKELYNEILKNFYSGVYKKNDSFPTQLELKEQYNIGINSVRRVFKMLREDGFIKTNHSRGTVVTFDINGQNSIDKMPFYGNDEQDSFTTRVLPVAITSIVLTEAVKKAKPEKVREYISILDEITECLQHNQSVRGPFNAFKARIYEDLDNSYIEEISRHVMFRLCYFNHKGYSTTSCRDALQEESIKFCQNLKEIIREGRYSEINSAIDKLYGQIYDVPRLLLFSVSKDEIKIFKEQTLYLKFINSFFVAMITQTIKKGDILPTETDMAANFNMSIATVRRGNDVLQKIGIIERKKFVGTTLIADATDTKVQNWLKEMFRSEEKSIKDAFEGILLIGKGICPGLVPQISIELIDEMEEIAEQQRNRFLKYNKPFFVAEVFIEPMIIFQGSNELNKYYFHIHEAAEKYIALFWLKLNSPFEYSEEIWNLMKDAIKALREKDTETFMKSAEGALRLSRVSLLKAWNCAASELSELK